MGQVTVVFDTNVLVSALGFGGTPLEALLRAFQDDVDLVATDATISELDRVLGYERLPFTEEDRQQYRSILETESIYVESTHVVAVVERDPADNRFLECALAADATFIVPGDDHLLELESYRGVDIVTPAAFLRRVD